MKPGRNDPCPCGSGRKYKQCCLARAAASDPQPASDADACNRRAAALQREGRLADAAHWYQQAIALAPDIAELHYNLGTVLQSRNMLDEAAACYRSAVERAPRLVSGWNNLGNVLRAMQRYDEAADSFRRALELQPAALEARYNLAAALRDAGDADGAIACYRDIIARASRGPSDARVPPLADAYATLGYLLHRQGALDEAIACYRAAIVRVPRDARLHNNLGNALNESGRFAAALDSYRKALELDETPEIRANFARCLRNVDATALDARTRALSVRAMREGWTRPADLVQSMLAAVTSPLRLEDAVADALLAAVLVSAPVCDLGIERSLTRIRRELLDHAESAGDRDNDQLLAFACALAQQCFINEFVFARDDDEMARVTALTARLCDAIEAGQSVPALRVAAAGSYIRLSDMTVAEALLRRPWPAPVLALLTRAIAEPLDERRDRDIRRLTPIGDAVSISVQEQYEANPYPRWITLPAVARTSSLDAYLREQFPRATIEPLPDDRALDVLIAGCGTGQEALETARRFDRSRILAVDLSAASLAYARRKTREARVDTIDYAQADILGIGAIGRTFDMISSVGVLHHLADPAAGLEALVQSLRPHGVMRLGFYSERARRDVVDARSFIAEHRYTSSVDDIRDCRQAIAAQADRFGPLLSRRDFYDTSGCRDLLFHVQEHRLTIPAIAAMLDRHRLRFLGFLVEPHVLNDYRARFPHDVRGTDLVAWDRYESERPQTFVGMYRFWVQASR